MRETHRHEATDGMSAALTALGQRYDVERELGRGGMAVVYLAREREGGRRVAIKLISARYSGDAEAVRRFAREARTAAALQHPNIVRTLAIEELVAGESLAIVSAFAPGETLRDALDATGAFPFDRAASVLRDVAAALAHAHGMRIVHRDVKPENIFLVGDPGRALLADFGIARELDSQTLLTMEGSAIGTPAYMSPEQVDGLPVDGRTDVYSLGLVGWEMLAGERPWHGQTLYAVLHNQKHERLPSLAELRPDIPAYLLTAIEGAIEKDPARRWQSASEFLRRLTPAPARPARAAGVAIDPEVDDRLREAANDAVAEGSADTVQLPRRPRTPGPRGPARAAWAVAIVMVAATGLLLLYLLSDGSGSPVASAAPDTTVADEPAGASGTAGGVIAGDTVAGLPAANERIAAGQVATSDDGAHPRTTTPPRNASPSRGATPSSGLRARCASPTAADQRACLLTLIARQDVSLDRTYQALIAELRRDAGGVREPPAVQALRAQQRAWLATRDSGCRAEAGGELGGTWAVLLAPCFERQSTVREAELRTRLERLRTGASR